MKIMGMSVIMIAVIAVVGFIGYKKFIKKDMWGGVKMTRSRIKRVQPKPKKEKKSNEKTK